MKQRKQSKDCERDTKQAAQLLSNPKQAVRDSRDVRRQRQKGGARKGRYKQAARGNSGAG